MHCEVRGCTSSINKTPTKPRIRFFNFPKNSLMREKWKWICDQKTINFEKARICELHFKPTDFFTALGLPYKSMKTYIISGTIPTVNCRSLDDFHMKSDETTSSIAIAASTKPNHIETESKASYSDKIRIQKEEIRCLNILIEQIKYEKKEKIASLHKENICLRSELVSEMSIKAKKIAEVNSLKKENMELRNRLARVESYAKFKVDRANLQSQLLQSRRLLKLCSEDLSATKKMFIPPPTHKPRDPNHDKNCWSKDDMTTAIALYDFSPEAYSFWKSKGFLVPAESTVISWKDWESRNESESDEPKSKLKKANIESEDGDDPVELISDGQQETILVDSDDEEEQEMYSEPSKDQDDRSGESSDEVEATPVIDEVINIESDDEVEPEPNSEDGVCSTEDEGTNSHELDGSRPAENVIEEQEHKVVSSSEEGKIVKPELLIVDEEDLDIDVVGEDIDCSEDET